MMGKMKIVSCVFCALVILVCLICYSGYVSQMYYEVRVPYEYSPITGYKAEVLDEMPKGYGHHSSKPSVLNEMKVVEITYELTGVVNEPLVLADNLCYYYGEDGGWIDVLEKDESYWGEVRYDGSNIVPPGERVIYREYVLVPKGADRLNACRVLGENEEMIIEF